MKKKPHWPAGVKYMIYLHRVNIKFCPPTSHNRRKGHWSCLMDVKIN